MTNESTALCQNAMTMIHNEYRSPHLTVQGIADTLYVSPTYLTVQFKKIYGIGVKAYLIKFRLEAAAVCLSKEEATIGDIALKNGFNYAAYFAKVFRDTYGCSPRAYREKSKSGNYYR